jgi:hypothetical protein
MQPIESLVALNNKHSIKNELNQNSGKSHVGKFIEKFWTNA